MSRFFANRPWLWVVLTLLLFTGCASHQGEDHPGPDQAIKTMVSRMAAGDRVLFLGLSGADGQADRLAGRVYSHLNPLLSRACRKKKVRLVDPQSLELVRRLWRLDLSGVARKDPGAAALTGVGVVVRGTVVRDGNEARIFLRADDIRSGRIILDDTEAWVELARLPKEAPLQEHYDSAPYRAKSEDGRLEFWSDSPGYDPGSDMHFFFKVTQKGYVTIFEINSAGEKRVIYPNTFQPRGYCRPGFAYQVPAAEVPLSLSATGPDGYARYVAVLTGRPGIAEIGMGEDGPGFTDLLIQGAMSRAAIRVRIQ